VKKKKSSKKSPIERFMALSDAEKEAEVAPFEKGNFGLGLPGRALNPSERKKWQRIKRGLGRPKIGQGAAIVPVSIERGLLQQVDAYARANHLKRSQMVAEGLRLVMRTRKAG
jgi:hypothetical protein